MQHLFISRPLVCGMLAATTAAGAQQQCAVHASGKVGASAVELVQGGGVSGPARFGLFKASLAVNTDGAPTSYHPDDFFGERLAINRLDNGISIRRFGMTVTPEKRKEVFEKWRDNNWRVPSGYKIKWSNVIAPGPSGKPCVFKQENAGYLGSLTALKNGLSKSVAGECSVKDQLDQRFIPAIVLRGDANPLKKWGAKTGDLVLAINPATGITVPAVIGDTGDGDRIGEGSVALNMTLLGKSQQPKTYAEARALDTGNQKMLVAIIPGSVLYKRERPYTTANIASRMKAWAEERYGSLDAFKAAMKICGDRL